MGQEYGGGMMRREEKLLREPAKMLTKAMNQAGIEAEDSENGLPEQCFQI